MWTECEYPQDPFPVDNSCGKICGQCGKLWVINRYFPPFPPGGKLWIVLHIPMHNPNPLLGFLVLRYHGTFPHESQKKAKKFTICKIYLLNFVTVWNPSEIFCEKPPKIRQGIKCQALGILFLSNLTVIAGSECDAANSCVILSEVFTVPSVSLKGIATSLRASQWHDINRRNTCREK